MIYRDYILKKEYLDHSSFILDEWIKYLGKFSEVKVTKNKREKMDKVCRCFIYNLAKFKTSGMGQMFVSLNRTDYSEPLIYNGVSVNRKVSYTFTRMLFDFLVVDGWALLEKGEAEVELTVDGWGFRQEKSKLIFTDKFMHWFYSTGIEREGLDNCVFIRVNGENIAVGKSKELDTSTLIMQMYNAKAARTSVVLGDTEYPVNAIKVFNDDLSKGGRVYLMNNGWKLLKRPVRVDEETYELTGADLVGRLGMQIDGVPVVEVDYCANHPRICYTLVGIDIGDFDPYAITMVGCDDGAIRDVAKFALLCLLNASNERDAMLALNKHIGQSDVIKRHKEKGLLPQRIPSTEVIRAVYSRNEAISEFFFQESWGRLQRAESLMMEYVIDTMMQNDQFIIPIHDSVLCKEDQLDFVKGVMYDAYEHVLGDASNCRLKVSRKEDFLP